MFVWVVFFECSVEGSALVPEPCGCGGKVSEIGVLWIMACVWCLCACFCACRCIVVETGFPFGGLRLEVPAREG